MLEVLSILATVLASPMVMVTGIKERSRI